MVLDIITRKHTNPKRKNTRKSMKWILIDSIIIALISLCSVMPETIPTKNDLWIMFKAFLAALFVQLAIERGIKRK